MTVTVKLVVNEFTVPSASVTVAETVPMTGAALAATPAMVIVLSAFTVAVRDGSLMLQDCAETTVPGVCVTPSASKGTAVPVVITVLVICLMV